MSYGGHMEDGGKRGHMADWVNSFKKFLNWADRDRDQTFKKVLRNFYKLKL